ncbi:MAG TPA: hypothetical protein VD978_11390 [Azospirillum sp.]|nr:hypothetical protein [Azospirillum sp.]
MRTLLFGAAAALALLTGSATAADNVVVAPAPTYTQGPPSATNWNGSPGLPVSPGPSSTTTSQTYTDSTGATVTTTTTTTTYPPGTAPPPTTTYETTTSSTDTRVYGTSESGLSPRDSQMATGTHCPPGTPDCGSANR